MPRLLKRLALAPGSSPLPKQQQSSRPTPPALRKAKTTREVATAGPWNDTQLRRMRDFLGTWYKCGHRDLPWRRTRDSYAITVSEFMLQQTQVATVIPYYERWMRQFPHWQALAEAKEETVIKAWEGLGYYRRARNLQGLARAVITAGGELPRDAALLRRLPGIGPYTAAAIGSIAFDLPVAVLDGNVMRVLTRLLACADDIALPKTRDMLQLYADQFLDRTNPSRHNQAVMELGATICAPRNPLCLLCPLKGDCLGRPRANDFPVKTRVETIRRQETVAILRQGDAVYAEQVPEGKPWHGLWRFPDFDPERMKEGKEIATIRYGITKYAVTMTAVEATWRKRPSGSGLYVNSAKMAALAFAAPHRKVIAGLTGSV